MLSYKRYILAPKRKAKKREQMSKRPNGINSVSLSDNIVVITLDRPHEPGEYLHSKLASCAFVG